MTLIALPFAVYLHTTTAFVLSEQVARAVEHGGHGADLPDLGDRVRHRAADARRLPHAALRRVQVQSSMFRSLATLLATVIIIDLFLLFVEILTIFWPTAAKPGHTLRFDPFLLRRVRRGASSRCSYSASRRLRPARGRKTRHLPAIQITAAAMYVVAIFLKRYSLMSMGFAVNPLGTVHTALPAEPGRGAHRTRPALGRPADHDAGCQGDAAAGARGRSRRARPRPGRGAAPEAPSTEPALEAR
jgi:hypothetical protein